MPYTVRKGKGRKPYKIVNKKTGRQAGASRSKKKAQASARVRNAVDHGWKPTGKKR